MPRRIPDLNEWMAASKDRALLSVLGIVGHDLGEGWCEYRISPTPASSDGRGSVSSFATTVAADMGVLVAATSTVDTDFEENSGTAELNMTYIEPPEGDLVVRSEVAAVARTMRIVLVSVRDSRGVLVAQGRGTYAIRQKSRASAPPRSE